MPITILFILFQFITLFYQKKREKKRKNLISAIFNFIFLCLAVASPFIVDRFVYIICTLIPVGVCEKGDNLDTGHFVSEYHPS